MDCSPPGSSVRGISQPKILEWVAISFSRGSSWLRDRTHISCLADRFFTTETPGKPYKCMCIVAAAQRRSGKWPRGDTPRPRSGVVIALSWNGRVEILQVQGQKNPSKMVGIGEAVRRYPKSKGKKEKPHQDCSVQFSHSVVSDSLRPHGLQHARPPCPSPTPRVYSSSCPSSWWCHPAISSSVVPFSSCPQSLPASGSFPMSQLFAWGGQSIEFSASASVLPMNTQDWSPLGWTGWISMQSKGLSRVFSNTTVQKHQFFCAQLSL